MKELLILDDIPCGGCEFVPAGECPIQLFKQTLPSQTNLPDVLNSGRNAGLAVITTEEELAVTPPSETFIEMICNKKPDLNGNGYITIAEFP